MVHIKRATVIVDVCAKTEGKLFLIEIRNIEDSRKHSLMEFYASQNPNIEFVHETYGENKIPLFLSDITSKPYKKPRKPSILQKIFGNRTEEIEETEEFPIWEI